MRPSAERAAANARRHNRHPPPGVAGAKHLATPARDEREEPRTEVARRVDCVAGVEAERRADQQDEQADDHGRKASGRRRIARVGDAEDDADEQRRADDLIDETTRRKTLRKGCGYVAQIPAVPCAPSTWRTPPSNAPSAS